MDKAIRAAKLTAAGILNKARARTAVDSAGGQIAPSKYLPSVPRQVHAAGGPVAPQGYSLKVDPDRLGVLARFKGKNVGQLTLSRDRETGKLSAFQMAVHPDHQRKGLMSAMHDAAEQAFGPMEPDKTLTDDGFAFWKGYRPDAVSNNLRFHTEKLIGQTVKTPYGPGTVKSVGSTGMIAELESGNTGWARASDNEDVLRGLGIDPSTIKYASGGRIARAPGGYVPQASIAYKSLPVGQAPAVGGGTSLGDFAQMASMMGGKEEAAAPHPQHHQNDGHDHSGMSDVALQAWNKLTDAYGQPLTIVSGYRDPQQNEAAGGAKGSQHLHGNAYDIDTSGMSHEDRLALAAQAYNSGFRGFGFYDNNMHFDVGDQRAWGPSHSSDSIPEWAQPFVQQYVARADGGKVENFQSWFGNSVTHTDGEPHVFYTGTSKDKDFTAFNVGRHGAWFTRDPEVASSYAAQNDSQGYKWEGGRPIKTNTASRVIPAYVKAENPYTGEYSGAVTGNYKSDQSNWFDSLRAKGHDAWIPASSQGQLAVVLREPQQIKSIYNNGKFDPNQKQMNRATGGRTVNKLNMYSKAAEVARSLPQAKGSVDQMLAMLRKGGVKPAELEHAGRPSGDMIDRDTLAKHFEDRLPKVSVRQYGEQPFSMTQDENQEYNHLMNRHHASQYRTGAGRPEPLSPEELERFEDLRSRLSRKDPVSVVETGEDEGPADTTYHDYQTPGGKDYRERLLTLPKRKGTPSWTVSGPSMLVSREHDTKEAAEADAAQMNSRLSPDIHPSRRHRVFETTRKSTDNYRSGHWGNDANVLAHIRMKDMPVDGKRALHIEEIQSDWAQEGRKQGFKPTDSSAAATNALPNAPYVKNTAHWTDLALKNVLAEAAHGRYDHVTFTGGQEQADRYGLEKKFSKLELHRHPLEFQDNPTGFTEGVLKGFDKNGRKTIDQPVFGQGKLHELVGQDMASKLLSSEPDMTRNSGGQSMLRHTISGDDLKMGGEGMKGYYDSILPKAAMKLVQQHDPSIQPSTINGNFGFTMTPKARESILQGQPAFAKGGEVDNNNQGDNQYGQTTSGNRQISTETQGLPVAGGVRGGQGLLPAPAQASGEKDLIGLPTAVKMPKLGMTLTAGHDPRIRAVARDYAQTSGLDYNPPTIYQKVDPERAKRIAAAYDAMPHDPDHPLVKASYSALLNETLGQYQAMKRAGMKMEFYPDVNNDPYKSNPRLAVEDVRNNNHMYVYPTDAGFGSGPELSGSEKNPMLGDSGERWNGKPVMFNDLFRAVHDYFGHAKEGVGFRADGEENAWRSHAAMFSPLARIALGTETRGQNSWLNYGPHGEKNRTAATEDTVFADQKLGILPEWAHHEGAEDFIRPHERQQMQAIYRTHRKSVGGALDLTRGFTKNGAGVIMSLKSKGK